MSRGSARGRAARVVAPAGTWGGLRAERRHVVAWLLRSHRLLAPDTRLRQVGPFVEAFRGGSWERPIDATRISKWEITSAAPDAAAVHRYEELLDLPRGHLVACMDVLLRYTSVELRPAPVLARPSSEMTPEVHARLAETVQAVHEDTVVDGRAWDLLTHFLAVTPAAVLLRPDSPSVLAARLLQEMVVADDQAWRERYESLCRLLAHPTMGPAAVAACVEMGSDPTNQVFIDPWSALDSAPLPDAGRHLARQLQQPLNSRAFHGAVLGCVRKSEHGHFAPDDAAAVVRVLRPLVAEPSAPAADRYVARAVLRRLDPTRVRPVQARPPTAGMLAVQAVMARIDGALRALDLEQLFGFAVPFEDEMLPRVVHASLSAEVDDERLYLAMAIGASPYRDAVADILRDELAGLKRLGQTTLLERVVATLRVLGRERHAPAVADLVTDTSVPASVRSSAAYALGHMGATSSLRLVTVLEEDLGRWRAGRNVVEPPDEQIVTAAVYALGVSGQHQVLLDLDDRDAPSPVSSSLRWWRDQPAAVRRSVGR